MVGFNFQPEFIRDIKSGKKHGTIRRTRRCEPGDKMHLYTGMRTKDCKLIAVKKCVSVQRIIIEPRGLTFEKPELDGKFAGLIYLDGASSNAHAVADGFTSYMKMYEWFLGRYKTDVFHGFLHRWAL